MKIRKQISKKLAHNTGMKVLAFFSALLLWFYVAILQDPEQTANIRSIPIEFANTAVIKDKGLFATSEISEHLNLKVRAKRSVLAKVNNKNIQAIIDLSSYNKAGEFDANIEIRFPSGTGDIAIENRNFTTIKIDIDTNSKRTIDIEVEQSGSMPSGMALDEIVLETKRVTVEGPKKILDLIDRAVIEVHLSRDMEFVKDVKLYSSNGVEIINDLLVLSDGQIKGKIKTKTE